MWQLRLLASVRVVVLICVTGLMVFAAAQLPIGLALALLTGLGFVAYLGWQLIQSRRRLMDEHAAHVAKSMFLANMSHELRTPLNAILGFSEVMRGELLGPVGTAKYLEYSGDIHAAASHLLELINDVLDLSRIEAGRQELHESPVELAALLRSCRRLLLERARRNGVDIVLTLPEDLPDVVCDAAKMKQVMLNLLTNAVKFTPRGGRVTISSCHTQNAIEIHVSDTGIGIAQKDIARIFTPFLRAADQRIAVTEGTGLGLPLSKRLVELHGGSLRVVSDLGQGTRVTVALPGNRCCRGQGAVAVAALGNAAA